ncbi:MAG: hypothetical protein KAT31_10830 [Bacteroidales bacterium]|nr:hypothetical protein [Bacteroidales bacterium]
MKIVLLTYVNRSGSTYLANLLSASDDICVCPEGDLLVSLFLESPGKAFRLDKHRRTKLVKLIQSDSKLKYWGVGDDIFNILEDADSNIVAFLAFLHYYQLNQKPEASCILFKAERLADLFSAIENSRGSGNTFKYLSIIRDPRGVYESQRRTQVPGTGRSMSSNPVYTAIYWNHHIRAILKCRKHIDCYQILYNDFIWKMDEVIRTLSIYLGLDLKGITAVEGDLSERLPDSHRLIHQTISDIPLQEKIDEWRKELNQEEISLIERKCKRYFGEFGFVASRTDHYVPAITCKMNYYSGLYQTVQNIRKARFHLKRIFKLA